MKNRIPFYIGICLLLAAVCYLLTSRIIYALLVLTVGVLLFLLFIEPLVSRYQTKMRKGEETYRFIHSFVISLSASKSMDLAFRNAAYGLSGEEKAVLESVSDKSFDERLEYLSKYFQTDIYRVFLSSIRLYEEEGGEILDIASPLLKESTAIEEDRISHSKNVVTSLAQFSSLWLMSLLVMGILRFGLSSFYQMLANHIGFILLVMAYFLIAYVSFLLFAIGITKEKIQFKGVQFHGFKKKKQNH
ncbi:MAG TPA: hypothetical protein DD384_01000 [Firmicutes bacterium]|nr:hypothetical protein [Bacillota bacterium]